MSREPLTLGKAFEKKVLFSLGVVSSGRMPHTAGITARDVSRFIKIMIATRVVTEEFARLFVPSRPREAAWCSIWAATRFGREHRTQRSARP
jgi:hypothetical protein